MKREQSRGSDLSMIRIHRELFMIGKMAFFAILFAAVTVGCGTGRGNDDGTQESDGSFNVRNARIVRTGDQSTVTGEVDGRAPPIGADVSSGEGTGTTSGVRPLSGGDETYCLFCVCHNGHCSCAHVPCE